MLGSAPVVLYRLLIKRFLFLLDPETAHRLVMAGLSLLSKSGALCWFLRRLFASATSDPVLTTHMFGQELSSPLGLAAGLDKDAEAYEAFAALGFGFVEVGTVTALAQPGNPRPRLFRLPKDNALINRMGFNNHGARAAERRLARPRRAVVGANIGRSKVVPNEAAVADYVESATLLAPHVSYMVVNVSSPNTPSLRELQSVEHLRPLITSVQAVIERTTTKPPLFLKVAPDLSDAELDAIADLALELGIAGIIATNTTIARTGLRTEPETVESHGAGGLSGAPLCARSLSVLERLYARTRGRLILIAAGGISSADDAWERITAGANLVQIYSALIFEGPGLPARINRELAAHVKRAGFARISDAVGSGAQAQAQELRK